MNSSGHLVQAILFDLDGTLVDTAPDITIAANRMLVELGAPPLSSCVVRSFIGKGIPNLVKQVVALAHSVDEEDEMLAQVIFNRHYKDCNGHHSHLYPGVLRGLSMLQDIGYQLGVVTNKPHAYTLPLLDAMGITNYFSVVISGDSLPRMKPDPLPLMDACRKLGANPGNCIMVGDSGVDVAAARGAGMPIYIVRYGYHGDGVYSSLACTASIDSFEELPELLRPSTPTELSHNG